MQRFFWINTRFKYMKVEEFYQWWARFNISLNLNNLNCPFHFCIYIVIVIYPKAMTGKKKKTKQFEMEIHSLDIKQTAR